MSATSSSSPSPSAASASPATQQAEKLKEQGNDEFKKGNYEKALIHYSSSIALVNSNHTVYTNRAFCYEKMKRYADALQDADVALAIKPDWEKGHYRRGVALRELGQFAESLSAFDACCSLNRNNVEYRNAYDDVKAKVQATMTKPDCMKMDGNDYYKRDAMKDAIQCYTRCLQLLVDDSSDAGRSLRADAYSNRAAAYIQMYDAERAREDCSAALAQIPIHHKALIRRGLTHEELESYSDAVADFEAALAIDSEATYSRVARQGIERCKTKAAAHENGATK